MTLLLPLLLSTQFLFNCLNAAIAALVACAIALVLSGRADWSLPTRHALLVVGLVASLLIPLAMPMVHLPTVWAIPIADAVDAHSPTDATRTIEAIHREQAAELPVATSMPVVEASTFESTSSELPSIQSVWSVPDPNSRAPQRESQAFTTTQWVRLFGTLLCGIWFAGIAAGIARASLGLVQLRRWSHSVAVADHPLIVAAAGQAAENLGTRQKIVIYKSSLLPAPISFGLLHPRIVVPTGIESRLAPDQLIAVIQHEMAHIVRGDLWIGLLQQVAAIAYWWNPLVLTANRRLADLREQICDDIAIGELAEPSSYAATLISLAERCSHCTPLAATLGIGSSPASQLESRIRRILSSSGARCTRLSRWSIAGVSATAVLMTATILLAQVHVKPTQEASAQDSPTAGQTAKPADKPQPAPAAARDPTLHDLIQQMAVHERMYFPFDIQVMETFRFPDDLSPRERATNLRADGRKHQRLMEYAQLARRIWRDKETDLVDDEIEQGPYERFCDGERIIQRSPSSVVVDGNQTLEYYVNNRKNEILNYLHARPLGGVFCLSMYSAGELFSEAFKDDAEAIELTWDKGDAKLTFGYGKPHWNTRYVLWLSRDHDWHPIRLQRFWDAEDKLFHDEWEVTKFVQQGKVWRVAEGTHRYRPLKGRTVVDPKIKYSMDFKILAEKYGDAVDATQFKVEIPAGAKVRESDTPEAEPTATTNTREITVTVVDVEGQPIPKATVRLPASQLRDHDVAATDEQGIAKSSKAPADKVTLQITAAGFRPVTWILGDVNELRAIMTPKSPGVVVDQGKPVAEAWITNRSLQIRADGYTYVPSRDWDGRDDDWSGPDGNFALKSNLTLRRTDAVVPLIAVNPNRDKMAIRFVKASELGQQQELALQDTCLVTGHCLLTEMTEPVEVGLSLTTSTDQYIGFLSTRRELTKEGLRVDYQLRMPPGDYLLKSGQTAHHSGFTIPVTIPSGKAELNLGTKSVSPTGLVALKGKPAPELKFQWRPGQEKTWENLRGKVVVLYFWGTWCGPCVAGMPDLMDVAEQFRDKPVQWLSVHTPNLKSFDELDREIAVCQEKSWNNRALPFTTVVDRLVDDSEYSGQTSRSYSVAEWPTLVVVDQQGKVVGPVYRKQLAETIAQLLDRGTEN
jgi:beta-lactamase regulating signal transducer with metallopeptidase domain/thiol-disulfide isomerase/thioredoxin